VTLDNGLAERARRGESHTAADLPARTRRHVPLTSPESGAPARPPRRGRLPNATNRDKSGETDQ
jgi:hypothetical protein